MDSKAAEHKVARPTCCDLGSRLQFGMSIANALSDKMQKSTHWKGRTFQRSPPKPWSGAMLARRSSILKGPFPLPERAPETLAQYGQTLLSLSLNDERRLFTASTQPRKKSNSAQHGQDLSATLTLAPETFALAGAQKGSEGFAPCRFTLGMRKTSTSMSTSYVRPFSHDAITTTKAATE